MSEEDRTAYLEALRKIREAYLALFGPPGEPTVFGRVVLEDLDRFCTTFRESIHMDLEGRMDPFTTIYRDGKKAVALHIRKRLETEYADSNSHPDTGQ